MLKNKWLSKLFQAVIFISLLAAIPSVFFPYFVWGFIPQLNLSQVPPPPDVIHESTSLVPGGSDWTKVYYTNASLIKVVDYYRRELELQGWESEILDNPRQTCMSISSNKGTFVLAVQRFPSDEETRVYVYSPETPSRCAEKLS